MSDDTTDTFTQLVSRAAGSLVIVLLTTGAGCNSGVYRAGLLPDHLEAPYVQSAHRLNLAALSGQTTPSEVIQPGDLLKVTVASGLESERNREGPPYWNLRVAEDGSVLVPLVGGLRLAGLTLPDADAAIRQASIERGIYRNPLVAVEFERRRTNLVSVSGAVVAPGEYKLPAANSDVLAAIVAAGGLAEDADTIIEINHSTGRRDFALASFPPGQPPGAERHLQRIDLVEATHQGQSLEIGDGAAVTVVRRPSRAVYVTGLVKDGQQVEMPPDQDFRLIQAISMAGGRTLEIADKIRIVRLDPQTGEPVLIAASYKAAQRDSEANIRLAAGDVVSVEETPMTFTLEMLRSFIRFGFSASAF